MEVIDLHKKRLESERNDREKYQQLLRLERQRGIKLEAAFAKSELEFAQTVSIIIWKYMLFINKTSKDTLSFTSPEI